MGRITTRKRPRSRPGPEEERALLRERAGAALRGVLLIGLLAAGFGALLIAAPPHEKPATAYVSLLILGGGGFLLALAARRRGARIDADYDVSDEAEVGAAFAAPHTSPDTQRRSAP